MVLHLYFLGIIILRRKYTNDVIINYCGYSAI